MKLPVYILKFILLSACAGCLSSCMGKVPVDVVTDGKDLFFLLGKPAEVELVKVRLAKTQRGKPPKVFWLLGHDPASPVKSRKYPELGQIRYGRKYEGFTRVEGPFPLQKNTEYLVEINMPGKFAGEIFVITDGNTVLMPRPAFERQKKREYEISADKNGDKVFKAK